jgi:DNA-binding NarL/FixJ family response regulator
MIRIVIADDHAMFRQGLIRLLESVGMELVGECSTGEEALAAVHELKPDLLILDITMPGKDGISVAAELGREKQATKIIVLTMHEAPDICRRAMASGVAGYILKDEAFTELEVAIRAVMQGKHYVSQSMKPLLPTVLTRNSTLSEREHEVLRLIVNGCSNRVIAERLFISTKTVDSHRTNVMRKLGIHSTADLVRHALKTGLV